MSTLTLEEQKLARLVEIEGYESVRRLAGGHRRQRLPRHLHER